ncbi:hypothetical protein, partial [Cerasicoccus arenae]|uniref:hypothetical protein n=1 Tax=Cerasicoccus arenae TaxID=424488 RepID=UPI001F16CC2B
SKLRSIVYRDCLWQRTGSAGSQVQCIGNFGCADGSVRVLALPAVKILFGNAKLSADISDLPTAFDLPKRIDYLFLFESFAVLFHLLDSFLVEPNLASKS